MLDAILIAIRDTRIRAVSLALVLLGFTYASTIPYQSIVAIDQLGMSAPAFGWLIFLVGLFGTFGGLTLGYLSDIARDRKTMVLWCLAVGALGFAGFAVWPTVATFLMCSLLIYPFSGSVYGLLFGTVRSVANEVDASKAASINSAVRSIYAVSWIVVPALVGLMIAASGRPSDSFAIAAVAFALCLAFYWFYGPSIPGKASSAGSAAANFRKGLGLVTSEGRLIRLTALALVNSAHPLTAAVLPLVVIQQLGGSGTQVGIVLGLVAFLEIPIMLGVGAAVQRFALWQVIVAGGVIHAGFLILLTLVSSTSPLYLLAVLLALANAVLVTQHLSYSQELLPDRPGLGSSLLSIVTLISRAVAALLFGAIGWAYGIDGALWTSAAITLLGCVGIAALALGQPRVQSSMNPK